MKIVPRLAQGRFARLLRTFPAVLVLGPRQCGKTTFVRQVLRDWRHVDLEREADLSLVRADLEGFFATHPRHVVLDEAQRLPEIFGHLRHVIDRGRGHGRFVLLGSASPTLVRRVSETLAGRVGMLDLTPFLARELYRPTATTDRWFWGGLPPVHRLRTVEARVDWLDAYVATFLERDLPVLGVRLPAARLRLLWTMLTNVHGNLLNVSDLARSLGVSSHTVEGDLDVLEATFMIRRLRPFFANVQKRLTKSAKVYVRDTGLLHFLAGLRKPAELRSWARRGASFEGLVIEELAALAHLRLARPGVYFWRTAAGAEADLLLVDGRKMLPIEIKSATTVDARDLAGLRSCMSDLGLRRGIVVCAAGEPRRIGREIEVVPWSAVASGAVELLP